MSNNIWLILSKYQQLSVIILIMLIAGANISNASELNAGAVMNKMNADERFGYLSGVIEGLAYSRWLRDKPDSTGMSCIYNWYYKGGKKNTGRLDTWLNRHPDKPVGALMYVLIKKECGA